MSETTQPKGYTIEEFGLVIQQKDFSPREDLSQLSFSGENAFDLRGLCSGFNIISSLDSPTIRMEIAIYDTIDMSKNLQGNEYIKLSIKTDSSGEEELEIIQKVYKIGSVTKSERAQTYIIYTTSPSTALNETNRVFKSFEDQPGSTTVEDVEKGYLKETTHNMWEKSAGNYNFISTSWRPYDVISYVSDKIVGSESKRPGYMYWQTRKGMNFATMDYLCSEKNPTYDAPKIFTYVQSNLTDSGNNFYNIETVNYPDRANHLERMRKGLYSNVVIGILLPALTEGNLPTNGGTAETGAEDTSPAGSINPPVNLGAKQVFELAETLNADFPFPRANDEYFSEEKPTRIKIRALPGMKNAQNSDNPEGSSSNMKFDTITSSAYSASRWQLLNAIRLDITVPGNISVDAGDIVNIRIPKSQTEDQSERLELDETYSGNYIVIGVKHKWSAPEITTKLNLAKDSIEQ